MARTTSGATKSGSAILVDGHEDDMDVDQNAPTGYAKVGSTSAGESVPGKRKVSNTTSKSKPRPENGSKAKPPSVLEVEEDDDSEIEVATLPKGKASSSKGKAAVLPPAPNHSAKSSSRSGANGHRSADASMSGNKAKHPRRTDEEWEEILKHVTKQARDWEMKFVDLARARETTAEESLRTYKKECEKQLSVLREQNELLINQRHQMRQLAREGFQDQIQALRGEIDKRDAIIADKDALIADKDTILEARETELKTLRSDLTAEVNHNKDISAQLKALRAAPIAPSTSLRPSHLSHSPDGHTSRVDELEAAILLYEELSKVLILSCSQMDESRCRYICAVHHANKPDATLRFSLTDVVAPEGSEDTTDRWYLYTPLDQSAFTGQELKYFQTQFRFPKSQALDLMLQMLELLDYKLYGDGEDDGTTENDDEVQELSHVQ